MVYLNTQFLCMLQLLVTEFNIVVEAGGGLVVEEPTCDNSEALTVQCFDEKTQSITTEGTYRRDESIMVKLEQIEGACDFKIPEYRQVAFKDDDSNLQNNTIEMAQTGTKHTEDRFKIPPYHISIIGKTVLKIFPLGDSRTLAADPVTCSFVTVYSKVKAVLVGGKHTMYTPNQQTTIDASDSENTNKEFDKKSDLDFSWQCEVLKGQNSKFCNDTNLPDFAGQSMITIPASESKEDYVYKITVIVQISGVDNPERFEDRAFQVVKFSNLKAEIHIKCIKNCVPKSDRVLTSTAVILKLVCKNCEALNPEMYFFWTIQDSQNSDIDYNKLKYPSRKGDTCYINADTLEINEVYTVSVESQGDTHVSLSSEFTLDTKLPPPLRNCTIKPTSGTAFHTGFQAECTYFPGDNTFEIYSLKDEKAVLLTKTNNLENEAFYLPAGASVRIEMIENKSGYTQSATATVEVKEMLNLTNTASSEEVNNIVGSKIDDVIELANSGNSALALQGLAAVVGEYSDSNMSEDLELEMDHKAIDSMTTINIDSPEQAKQAVDILSQITEKYHNKPDPDLSLKSSEICNKASKVLSAEAHKFKNPDLKRLDMLNNVKSLSSCSQAGLGANLEAVEEKPVLVIAPITEFPIIEMKKIPEDYAEYTDDIKSNENIVKFQQAAERMKNICFSNAKMIALTTIPEEDPVENVQGSMSIFSARRYCNDLSKFHIGNDHVKINLKADCKSSPVIDIMICIVDKNPYWWKDNDPLITKVVYAKFGKSSYQETVEHSQLDEDPLDSVNERGDSTDSFTVTFEINENISITADLHQAVLPDKPISQMDEDGFYEDVSTHRIYVFKDRGFTVNFSNMTTDDYYDVVLTEFEKPEYVYFKNHYTTVYVNNSLIFVNETRSYDTFWFVSLLPNEKMANNLNSSNGNYLFSVSTVTCYTWNDTIKEYVFACIASSGTSSKITCYCTHGDVFIGHIVNNIVILVENIIIQFRLEVERCWIIFVTTCAAFFVFCLILLFATFQKKDDILDKVFFVGDVPSYFQYAYIIAIKTGRKRQSGTTSNVTIKLYGSTADSMEHVLNYPDPELIMLQRNMDTWFVIATEKPLGDVQKIEIWIDSVGNNTKWYNSEIKVYDIQQNKSWNFKLENWFDIMMEEQIVFIIKPEEKTIIAHDNEDTATKTVIKAIKNFRGKIEGEVNLWNLGKKDPILMTKDRVVIIFSILMEIFLMIMLLWNIPNFDESDSIDENAFEFNSKLIWTPIVGATGVFLIHFPLVYLIKISKFGKIRKKAGFITDEQARYYCWILITVLSTISATVLICCGFWIPMDTSLLWLVSVVLGISFNIIVLENISRIIYGYLLILPTKIESLAKTTERIIHYVELQRIWLYKRFGALSLRPYFEHLYYKLDFVSIKERVKLEDLKTEMLNIIEDLIMILIYVTLLYLVLTLDKESMAVYSHNAVNNLVTGKLLGSNMDADTIPDIEEYFDKTLLPSIQSLQWYGRFIQDNPGMTKDFSNRYLGILRIRQHRTRELPCDVPKIMEFLNMTCRPEYSKTREFGDFSRHWEPLLDVTNATAERMAGIWKYSSSILTGTSSYFGKTTTYPGGGYVSTLGRTLKNSLINLKYLRNHKWLDLRTRAIVIEFLTYSPNVNLFNTVKVVFEINAAGSIQNKVEIQTRKLLMVDNQQIFTKRIIDICFAIILLILTIRIIYKFVKAGRQFFYDLWSVFDLGIVILSVISIYLYYARLTRIQIYVDDLTRAPNNQFVNYFHLFQADNILSSLTATLVFISTFRLWKLLRFMIIIQTAEKTLQDAAIPLLVCLLYQLVYIIAFAVCGTLFFGANAKEFMNFHVSFATLLLLSINLSPDFSINHIMDHPLGIPYYISYALLSLVFTNVYVSIITLYYGDAKDFYADERGFATDYIQEKWTYYKTLFKIKIDHLRGGEETHPDEKVIKPKMGDRYEDCMTMPNSRLQAMALVTMCVLRNQENNRDMIEEDFEMVSKMIKSLFSKESSEKAIFFVTGDSHHIEFVDNRRLEEIADICERLIVESKNLIRFSRKIEKPFFEYRMQRIQALIENTQTIKHILDNVQIRI